MPPQRMQTVSCLVYDLACSEDAFVVTSLAVVCASDNQDPHAMTVFHEGHMCKHGHCQWAMCLLYMEGMAVLQQLLSLPEQHVSCQAAVIMHLY